MYSLLVIIMTVLMSLTNVTSAFDDGVYFESGTVVESAEDSITIETSDGNLWVVDNYILPIGSDAIVEFTNDSNNVEDAEILGIIIVKEF